MPLRKIGEEISSLERMPAGDRSVADVECLADLRDARRRIAGSGCGHR
jgi:hypothetical protein